MSKFSIISVHNKSPGRSYRIRPVQNDEPRYNPLKHGKKRVMVVFLEGKQSVTRHIDIPANEI